MYGPIHTEEFKGYDIKIFQDADAQSPRDECGFGTIVAFGRKRHLSDNDAPRFDDADEFLAFARDTKALFMPVFMYDHSQVALSTETFIGRAQHAAWDSGQIGFVYITADDIRHQLQCKYITKRVRKQVYENLTGEVETYGSYLNGEVYEYVIEDAEGEVVDSLCGCYGLDYTLEEARAALGDKPECFADEDDEEETA